MSIELIAFVDLGEEQQARVVAGIADQIKTSRTDIVNRCCILANPLVCVDRVGRSVQLSLAKAGADVLALLLRTYIPR